MIRPWTRIPWIGIYGVSASATTVRVAAPVIATLYLEVKEGRDGTDEEEMDEFTYLVD